MTEAPLSTPAFAVFETLTGVLQYLAPEGVALEAGTARKRLPAEYAGDTHSWNAVTQRMVKNMAGAWRELRVQRSALLAACDWTQLSDAPDATRIEWRAYRQALRDLPKVTVDPVNPVWPSPPGTMESIPNA